MPEFAKLAAPLYFLLKKDVEFQWSPECTQAFGEVKEALIHEPVLAYPQFNSTHPFILETDASTRGLGAVLAQQQEDGKVHPIAFALHSLTTAEKNYAITELEILGLVWAVKTFRPYILGRVESSSQITLLALHCCPPSIKASEVGHGHTGV